MQLSLQLSKLQGTTSYFDGNMGRVGVKSDTVSKKQAQSTIIKQTPCIMHLPLWIGTNRGKAKVPKVQTKQKVSQIF